MPSTPGQATATGPMDYGAQQAVPGAGAGTASSHQHTRTHQQEATGPPGGLAVMRSHQGMH
jgi:hypothetical protein